MYPYDSQPVYWYKNMKTIALVTEKGGTGKSTVAVHLAVCALRQGKSVAVIDLDPQASARHWVERRISNDIAVVSATSQELPRLLEGARKQHADLVVIDTAGRSDVTTGHVIEAADLLLIPCRPSIYDLEASQRTAEQIKKAGGKKAVFVLNAVQSRGVRAQEAREALQGMFPVAPVELHQLVAYSDALNDGRSVEEMEPYGKAALEIRALYDWFIKL
jgi:chromosome partitioning protein